jgi:hypothetical protein
MKLASATQAEQVEGPNPQPSNPKGGYRVAFDFPSPSPPPDSPNEDEDEDAYIDCEWDDDGYWDDDLSQIEILEALEDAQN